MEKALSAYDTYRKNHDGNIDCEKEKEIAQPYLDAVWEDKEYSHKRVEEQALQKFRVNIKGYDNKRSAYREKKDGKYTDTVIDAGHTFEVDKIDSIKKSLDDISDANRASAKRVNDYKKYIGEEMQEPQTKLDMGDGTEGAMHGGMRYDGALPIPFPPHPQGRNRPQGGREAAGHTAFSGN